MSGKFDRLENVDFDNFEFMPEFDFDSFFKKIDSPEPAEEPAIERFDFQTRRHQARSEDDYTEPWPSSLDRSPSSYESSTLVTKKDYTETAPTFYTNQRYSEIARPKSFPDKLKDVIHEKRARLSEEPLFHSYGNAPKYNERRQPIVEDRHSQPNFIEEPHTYDYDIGKDFDNQRYTLPYESQSIRRLDGPFEPFKSEMEPPPESPKRRLIKVKVKKPIVNRSGEEQEDVYEKPSWRLPIQPIVEDEPDYYQPEINVGYYDPPSQKESLSYYEPPPPRQRYTAPSYTVKPSQSLPSRVPYKPRFTHETTTRPPTTFAPRTTYKPFYGEPASDLVKRRKDVFVEEKPSIFSDEPFQVPPYTPHQSYEKDIAEERQSINSQPNFLDEPFQIPSFFRSNFDEPSFAQFNPPFGASGMFVDFLKTIGDGNDQVPFSQPQLRTYVEDAPKLRLSIEESPTIHRYGSYDTEEIGGSPRWFSSNYKSEAPSANNGYFANDYIQDYGVKSTTTTTTTTTATTTETPKKYYDEFRPIIKEDPKPSEDTKPSYKPIEEAKPTYRPVKKTKAPYRPIEDVQKRPAPYKSKPSSTYKPPKKEKRPSVTYKPLKEPVIIKEADNRPPVANYRQPIQPIKDAKPTYKAETTTTEKPTESSVYYKAYENEEHTPGPVYYKPIEESAADITEAGSASVPITPSTTKPPQTDTDSVATAPKAPPKRKLNTKKQKKKKVSLPPPPGRPRPKKPYLRFPKLKFPKLPKAQPLQRRTKPAPLSKKKKKKPLPPPPQSRPGQAPDQAAPGPGQSRKGQIHPPPHPKNLLGKVKDIFTGHKRFIKRREGNPIAQSTAVLLPYVMSLL